MDKAGKILLLMFWLFWQASKYFHFASKRCSHLPQLKLKPNPLKLQSCGRFKQAQKTTALHLMPKMFTTAIRCILTVTEGHDGCVALWPLAQHRAKLDRQLLAREAAVISENIFIERCRQTRAHLSALQAACGQVCFSHMTQVARLVHCHFIKPGAGSCLSRSKHGEKSWCLHLPTQSVLVGKDL